MCLRLRLLLQGLKSKPGEKAQLEMQLPAHGWPQAMQPESQVPLKFTDEGTEVGVGGNQAQVLAIPSQTSTPTPT